MFSEDNWEEKLHELFNDNFEDDENPLGESYFLHLSPRSKIEVLLKLCELRLDVDGALDEIKVILIFIPKFNEHKLFELLFFCFIYFFFIVYSQSSDCYPVPSLQVI